ncbi:hypothetical protein [Cohnella yongneupensis]|uniref:Uncharacterized protein n=1 Tax=Cohnella yongneupensis TaxID=425006 RepID=A0ABW0QS98_9BACL
MDADMKPVIETIVKELLERIKRESAKPRKVLYIFCDSTAHEAYTDHFITLKNAGICHDILFLDGETSSWLGMHKLECGGPGRIIASDEFAPAPLEVPHEYDGIVIPEIDLDNAARIALGMKGTIKSEIAFAALATGKFVLVGDESSGLKRADRRTLRTISLPQPYRNLFDYYKQELRMYGVAFGPQRSLAQMAIERCGIKPDSPHVITEPIQPDNTGNMLTFEGKLVSADWLTGHLRKPHTYSKLTVPNGTLLSPLARDILKENQIELEITGKG